MPVGSPTEKFADTRELMAGDESLRSPVHGEDVTRHQLVWGKQEMIVREEVIV